MDSQGGCAPLPIAALSLQSFVPNNTSVQRPTRPFKASVPSSAIVRRYGLRSHPIDVKLADDVADTELTAQATPRAKPYTLGRLVGAISGGLNRLVSSPISLAAFPGPAPLSAMRVFPSAVPRRGARGGGGGALPAGGGARKAAVMWFRNDLRLHDNPSLDKACREGTSVLPVYVFDPRDYGQTANGFGRTGPARARFILESVADLRARLRSAGSDLLLRVGRSEEVLPELAAAVGAGAVYCQAEVTEEEAQVEGRVRAALERDGCELRAQWGGTLYQLDDLPFRLSAMPTTYADFRARVAGLAVRPLVASERSLKGLPQGTRPEPGDLPSLQQLGVPAPLQPSTAGTAGSGGFGAPPLTAAAAAAQALRGGESEALRHLQAFMGELKASLAKPAPRQEQTRRSRLAPAAASSFSCRISPWLALGCLSPRRMYLELKQQLGGQEPLRAPLQQAVQDAQDGAGTGAGGAAAGGGSPANWLVFELLWRDFFRFVTHKYALKPRAQTATAATVAAAAAPPRAARSAAAAPAYALAAA